MQIYNTDYYKKVLLPKNEMYAKLDRNRVYVDPIQKIIPKGSRVLDVATGISDIPSRLLDLGYEVHACDISKECIKKQVNGVNYKIADMFRLSYPKNYFHAIIAKDIIEHYEREKIAGWLPDIDKIMKPNGVLIIGVPAKTFATRIALFIRKISNRTYSAIDDTTDITHKHWYSVTDLKELITTALPSYRILEITYLMYGINNFPHWLIPILHPVQKWLHRKKGCVSMKIQKYLGFRLITVIQKPDDYRHY